MRIKLPGDRKVKSIILALCVVLAIGIIVSNGINNRMQKDKLQKEILNQKKEQQEYLNKINKEQDEKRKKIELDKKAGYADSLFYSRKYDDAIKLAEDIISQDNENYIAYNVLGITKIFKYRSLEDGMKDIDKALEIKSDYAYAMFNKGLGYELLGYYDEAIEWYNKNLEYEQYVWSYYGIASIYGRRGDVENTVKYFKKAIEINPVVKETAKDEHDFDNVRNDKRFTDLLK